MIAIVLNGSRIGSLLKFPHLKLPWCAYAFGGIKKSFKTRKTAIDWLAAKAARYELEKSHETA